MISSAFLRRCFPPFFGSRGVSSGSSLRPVQLLHVTVLFGNSLCTIRRLMRSSQPSSNCSVLPLATKNFALIATLLAVAVSHVQPSTVICCPLQVDRVDLGGLIMSRASSTDSKLAVHPMSGTAVTLSGCMPSFLLSSHNSRGGGYRDFPVASFDSPIDFVGWLLVLSVLPRRAVDFVTVVGT